jgi:hypothetical protein
VTAQVHADHRVPVVVRELGDGAVAQDARVVDQGVECAELAHRGGDEPVRHLGVGHVPAGRHRATACGDDLLGHGLARVRVELRNHDRRALARALQRFTSADAAPGPGDDHDLAVEKTHAVSVSDRPVTPGVRLITPHSEARLSAG